MVPLNCHCGIKVIATYCSFLFMFATRVQKDRYVTEHAIFDWSPKEQGIILGAFCYGYVLVQIPCGYLTMVYGGKNLLGYGMLLSGLVTMLIPVMTKAGGMWWFVFIRALVGLCQVRLFFIRLSCDKSQVDLFCWLLRVQ